MKIKFLIVIFLFLVGANLAFAQTTEFTYQGRLTDGGTPANSIYDFEFRLFGIAAGGTALGTIQRLGVSVSSGIFTVKLDFGANFNGQPRWLEIAVKPAGSPNPLTVLAPRQEMSSAPYAIRSLNAGAADTSTNSQQLGGVAANQFVQTNDSRLTDARNPLPNSPNYINNATVQQSADFNVSGSGALGGTLTANAVTSATQYNIGVNRVLAIGSSSGVFVGRLAGASNTTGSGNTFVGESAGRFNVSNGNNSFVGRSAGVNNAASDNSFFGAYSGEANTSGGNNSFFGVQAGTDNTTGINNAFFGRSAGKLNTSANYNAFFGFEAGMSNTTTGGNSFFGSRSGRSNTGLFNSFFGYQSGYSNTDADDNSFFGYSAGQNNTASNNSFFGSLAGIANTTGSANSFFGESAGESNTTGARNVFLGRWSGNSNTTGGDNVFVGFNSGLLNTTGNHNVFIGVFAGSLDNGSNLTLIGSNSGVPNGLTLQYATAIGADAEVSSSNTVQLGRVNGFDTVFAPGLIRVNGLGVAGSTNLCRNASNQIATCSSSLRYKTNVQTFTGGLGVLKRLRPITFNWIDGGINDIGFAAEEVNEIEPLLTTRNSSGEIEGVKYGQITTVLVNAVNEQQTQIEEQKIRIERQQKQLDQQQILIDNLKKLVCSQNPSAGICRKEQK